MPLYPLGISRSRDVPCVPKQAAGSVDMRWSLAGELACALIDAPHGAIQPMLHAAALEAIHRRICVLPVQFGMALRDEAEIHSVLEKRSRELLENLDRLDRTCEMALRIARTNPPKTRTAAAAKPQSPLDYIEERRSHYRRLDGGEERERSIVRQFVERLHGCYRQWRKLQSSPSHPIRMAFLVEQDRATAFRSRLEKTCETYREGRCVILGPWPPYSFV
ncbi:MAG: GvpL/GvpF family gas vesicle protein [Planctomycetes bacterium]|nr:GvpL/GvpF family gas vesicle protein [Planctomycetota bacterium]MBU4399138.1 GvpL/GvpF family gas vesicle protein [Planctomycetota bacterium]MCG2683655.1 GvpL/GvpF family gas vesicle protein [Planctomycetales bacterium]